MNCKGRDNSRPLLDYRKLSCRLSFDEQGSVGIVKSA